MKTKILSILVLVSISCNAQLKESFTKACLSDTFQVKINRMPYEYISEALRDSARLSERFEVSIVKDFYGYWLVSKAIRDPKLNNYGYYLKHGNLKKNVGVKRLSFVEKNKRNIPKITYNTNRKINSTVISASYSPFSNLAYGEIDHIFINGVNITANFGTSVSNINEYFARVTDGKINKIGIGIGYQINTGNEQFVISIVPATYFNDNFETGSCEIVFLKNHGKFSFVMGFDPIVFVTRIGFGLRFK